MTPLAGAAPEQKSYTAVVTPDPVGAGQTVAFTLTIKNTTKTQQIGSANLSAPSSPSSPGSFSLISATSPLPSGTATIVGSTVELRNLALPAGGTMTVTVTTEVPCSNGSYTWSIITKQSNNFSGPPGNNFILTPAGSDLVTAVSGQCSLRWLTQPSDAQTNTAITNTAYDAAFPPTGGLFIQAEVLSAPYAGGASPTRVTFSTDEVTLHIGRNPGGLPATLGGTISADAEDGVATFIPGPEITRPGPNYTLLATNPIMASGESTTFDISDAVCETPCITDETEAGGTRARVDALNVPAGGFVAASVGVLVELVCTPNPTPNSQVASVFLLDVPGTSTLRIDVTYSFAILDRPWSQVRGCLASAEQFTQADGTLADPVTIAGDPLFVGVPQDCDNQTPVPPCFLPSIRNNQPDPDELTVRLLVPGNDPHRS